MAMDIMRLTIGRLVKKYHITLAPGETGNRVLEDMKDQFVTNLGTLQLQFIPRQLG
ncbi:hypothetical protein GGR53DRAFT_490914 [Hypoxylon sp. FL1150]|nr:hypothetical protein GGR53DRAFT_490914 [Hypoxylon sp. FL1150]